MEHSQNQSRQTERIRILNDAFRQCLPNVRGMSISSGVVGSLTEHGDELFAMIREYDDFTPDNDPYGEHDFGIVEVRGVTVWWKIDYYDCELEYLSPDPSNEKITRRFLTLMLPNEY